jgi:hypothetical protein
MSFCIVLYFREIFFLRLLINTIQLWGAYSGCQISDQKMRPIKQLTIKSVPVYSCAQDPVVGRTQANELDGHITSSLAYTHA